MNAHNRHIINVEKGFHIHSKAKQFKNNWMPQSWYWFTKHMICSLYKTYQLKRLLKPEKYVACIYMSINSLTQKLRQSISLILGANDSSNQLFTLDFSSLLKNHFEWSFVSSECSLQSSNACFEVRSEYLRWLNSEQFDWLTYYGSQSELAKLAHCKLSEPTSKQTLELCNEHSELTNEHSKWFFKSELKSKVTMDNLHNNRLNFDVGKKNKILHRSLKGHLEISKTRRFDDEML